MSTVLTEEKKMEKKSPVPGKRSSDSTLLFEKKSLNEASWLPALSAKKEDSLKRLPSKFLRQKEAKLPSLSELDIVRHFTNLSHKNFCVDANFYPLGSCTMKYNPKCLDAIAAAPSFSEIHPYQKEDSVQGALKILFEMQNFM